MGNKFHWSYDLYHNVWRLLWVNGRKWSYIPNLTLKTNKCAFLCFLYSIKGFKVSPSFLMIYHKLLCAVVSGGKKKLRNITLPWPLLWAKWLVLTHNKIEMKMNLWRKFKCVMINTELIDKQRGVDRLEQSISCCYGLSSVFVPNPYWCSNSQDLGLCMPFREFMKEGIWHKMDPNSVWSSLHGFQHRD